MGPARTHLRPSDGAVAKGEFFGNRFDVATDDGGR